MVTETMLFVPMVRSLIGLLILLVVVYAVYKLVS